MLTHLCFSTASPFPFWFYHYYFFFLYPYGAVGFYLILFVRSAVGSNLFFFLSFPSYTGICCTFLAFTSEYKACWISFFFRFLLYSFRPSCVDILSFDHLSLGLV